VGRLRSFARLDQSNIQHADVHNSIDDAVALLGHELGEDVKLVRDYGELPRLRCAPRALNQLFLNLLTNAIHAVGGEGTITLSTRTEAGQVRISIQDDGVGIDAETLSHIFDPGFTTKGVGVGTGLGLSICFDIARQHGGHIEVESALGQGARFDVVLPLD
jgi:signal transduction histidine kinase